MKTSFYSREELFDMGFKEVGKDCQISKKASFYSIQSISFGDNVRIDDFCILSGDISIGSFVHISAYCALYGNEGITIGDYSGLSPRCTIFSAIDDFSGEHLINPMVPKEYTNVVGGEVKLHNYIQLGANSIVLPSITINEGSVTGAFTFVNKDLPEWGIYVGIPARYIKKRKTDFLRYIRLMSNNKI